MQLSLTEAEFAVPILAGLDLLDSQTPRKVLVVGGAGKYDQGLLEGLGRLSGIRVVDRDILDLDGDLQLQRDWSEYGLLINAAHYDAVDKAETPEGRVAAWSANAKNVGRLARLARKNDMTFIHFSSDDVFDGTKEGAYTERDPVSPANVFGQSMAAGELAALVAPKHYTLRVSWLVGHGATFLSAMHRFAEDGTSPRVVNDAHGRLTFMYDLGAAIRHLLSSKAPYGLYNVTSSGEPFTWEQIAREVFVRLGKDPNRVRGMSAAELRHSGVWTIAPRPKNSVLDLSKIEATGFVPGLQQQRIAEYLEDLQNSHG